MSEPFATCSAPRILLPGRSHNRTDLRRSTQCVHPIGQASQNQDVAYNRLQRTCHCCTSSTVCRDGSPPHPLLTKSSCVLWCHSGTADTRLNPLNPTFSTKLRSSSGAQARAFLEAPQLWDTVASDMDLTEYTDSTGQKRTVIVYDVNNQGMPVKGGLP